MLRKSFGCLDTSLFVCLSAFFEHQLKTLPVFHGLFGGPSCGDIRGITAMEVRDEILAVIKYSWQFLTSDLFGAL